MITKQKNLIIIMVYNNDSFNLNKCIFVILNYKLVAETLLPLLIAVWYFTISFTADSKWITQVSWKGKKL